MSPNAAERERPSATARERPGAAERPAGAETSRARSKGKGKGTKRARVQNGDASILADAEPDTRVDASEAAAAAEDGDTSILRELFGGSGLHSALNHNAIETANDPVKMNAERDASRLAERAALALRESRREIRQRPIHMCGPLSCQRQ